MGLFLMGKPPVEILVTHCITQGFRFLLTNRLNSWYQSVASSLQLSYP